MLLNGTQTESAPRTYFIPASSLKEKPPKSLFNIHHYYTKSIKYFFFIINLYSDLGGFQFSVASDGTPTYKPGGADTAYPFNSGMQKIVSVSTYCKFIGYDKTVFVSIVFDISKCKLMITTNINNSWFQYLYALSSTTSLPGDSVLSPNKNYDLSNYNYLRLTFNLPTGNYDGSNSTSLGTIQFK